MTQYWIFVSYPFSDFNHGTFSEIVTHSEQPVKWLIGKKTIHRKQLAKGDEVLFYQAGDEGKEMVGSGRLISSLQSDYRDRFFVLVGNIKRWEKPIRMKQLMHDLSFIKQESHWGLYFQGGIRRIQQGDYDTIIRKAKRRFSSPQSKS